MRVSVTRVVACVALAAVLSCVLVGCSSAGHQVISANETCSSCHSSEKETFEVANPQGALTFTPGTVVTVDSGDAPLALCKPIYTDANGTSYVPVLDTMLSSGGTVEVALEEGVWVLAADLGDASKGALVIVSPDAENSDTAIVL